MAHVQQREFCEYVKAKHEHFFWDVDVIDIGSLDVNGNNRTLFERAYYVGVDIGEGKNVDVVSLGHEFNPGYQADVVISTECFEHDMHWRETIKNCINLTRHGGLFMFTCATTGRPEHGTTKSLDWASPFSHVQFNDYYHNLTEKEVREVLDVNDFSEWEFKVNKESCDLYFYGIKK